MHVGGVNGFDGGTAVGAGYAHKHDGGRQRPVGASMYYAIERLVCVGEQAGRSTVGWSGGPDRYPRQSVGGPLGHVHAVSTAHETDINTIFCEHHLRPGRMCRHTSDQNRPNGGVLAAGSLALLNML